MQMKLINDIYRISLCCCCIQAVEMLNVCQVSCKKVAGIRETSACNVKIHCIQLGHIPSIIVYITSAHLEQRSASNCGKQSHNSKVNKGTGTTCSRNWEITEAIGEVFDQDSR